MNHRNRYNRRFAFMPAFALAAVLAVGAIVRLLWNAILPEVTGVNPISYWQSVGLLILSRILFGGWGRPGRGRPGWSRGGGPPRWGRRRWDNQQWNTAPDSDNSENPDGPAPDWRSKWKGMTDEDRIRFRQEMRRRCGRPPENI